MREEKDEGRDSSIKEILLFLPNVVKLTARLARDPRVPRSVKWGLTLFGLYLASPIDLIPDWIPIIGYLDDIVLVAIVGRWMIRRIPPELIDEHWDGKTSFRDALREIRIAASEKVPKRWRRRILGEDTEK